MRIGLMDGDLSPSFDNLLSIDLMKINTYYRGQKDIVSLFRNTEESSKFSKIYYNKDYNIDFLPKEIITLPGIEIHGEAFGKSLPEDIERCVPNQNFYLPILEQTANVSGRQKKRMNLLLRTSNVRLSSNGKLCENIEKCIIPKSMTLALHDKDITALDDWYDIISELTYKTPQKQRSIFLKFPLEIKTSNVFEKISHFTFENDFFCKFCADICCKDDFFDIYLDKMKLTTKLNFTFSHDWENHFYSDEEIIRVLRKILLREIFCQSWKYPFLLKYESKSVKEPLNTFLEVITKWSHLIKYRKYVTFFDYIRKSCTDNEKYKIQEVFNLDPVIKDIMKLSKKNNLERSIIYD